MKLLYSLISSTGDGGPSTEAADGDARVTRAQGKATNLGDMRKDCLGMDMQYTADAIMKKEMSEDNREARLRLMCEMFRKHVRVFRHPMYLFWVDVLLSFVTM